MKNSLGYHHVGFTMEYYMLETALLCVIHYSNSILGAMYLIFWAKAMY